MRPGRCRCVAFILIVAACGQSKPSSTDAGENDAGPADAGVVVDAGPGDAGEGDAGPGLEDGGDDAGLDGGACSFAVNYPLDYPCNEDADCQSGHCAFSLESTTGQTPPGICTTRCATQGVSTGCPTNFTCDYAVDGTDVSTFCVPTATATLLPGDGSLPFGSPCSSDADCSGSGTLCGLIAEGSISYSFCSPTCSTSDRFACGGCGTCEQVFQNEGTNCLPKGPEPIGAACSTRTDCKSFVCADFCTQVCMGADSTPCPTGSICVDDGQMQFICINPAQENATADGAACLFDFQCVAGDNCLSDSNGQTVCTRIGVYGEPCAGDSLCVPGLTCVPLDSTDAVCTMGCPPGCGIGSQCVAPAIDTVLSLYDSPGGGPVNSNDNANATTTWSEITTELGPGTYWVEVTSNTAFIQNNGIQYLGNYALSILDGVHTPVQLTELPQDPVGNQSIAAAQVVSQIPVIIEGTLGPGADAFSPQTDFYQFTITQLGMYTLTTGPGAPSFCVPTGRSIGDPCWTDDNCTSQLCDSTLKTCTETCTADADCGNGHCVSNGTALVCVTPVQYGSTADGQTCEFGWQCSGADVCAHYGTEAACGPPCIAASVDGGAATDGGSACNAATSECAAVTSMNAAGQTTSGSACVPLGKRSAAFGAACVLQSDCQAGLECTQGVCTASCTATAQCPNQNLIPPPGDTSTDVCQSCQNDADCGAGLCVQGPGYERFCGDPCDANGNCSTGFNCVTAFSGAGQVCAPAAGSCQPPTCQMGQCLIPIASYAEACTMNADCTTSDCMSGLCTRTCQSNSDCACPAGDLTCQSGSCQVNPSYLQSASTNFTAPQLLTGTGPWTLFGTMAPANNATEFYYSFKGHSGDTLNVEASPVCGEGSPGLELALELIDASGNVVMTAFPFDSYPQISSFALPSNGVFRVAVVDFGGGTSQPASFVISIQLTS